MTTGLNLGEIARHFERPELVSRGKPHAGREIKKVVHAARERVREGKSCVACPAGRLVASESPAGMLVRCAVERSLISEARDPSTLANRCLNDGEHGYKDCPSWRAEKERIWAGQRELVGAGSGVQ